MKARLAVAAINNAVARRGDVAGCILHTDRGSQFRSRKVHRALARHRMVGSMGQVGSAGDNAAMESFFALLQKNVLDRRRWDDPRRAPHRHRHLDRADLSPPPTSGRSRPVDPCRVRDHHDPDEHRLPNRTCHRIVQQSRSGRSAPLGCSMCKPNRGPLGQVI